MLSQLGMLLFTWRMQWPGMGSGAWAETGPAAVPCFAGCCAAAGLYAGMHSPPCPLDLRECPFFLTGMYCCSRRDLVLGETRLQSLL